MVESEESVSWPSVCETGPDLSTSFFSSDGSSIIGAAATGSAVEALPATRADCLRVFAGGEDAVCSSADAALRLPPLVFAGEEGGGPDEDMDWSGASIAFALLPRVFAGEDDGESGDVACCVSAAEAFGARLLVLGGEEDAVGSDEVEALVACFAFERGVVRDAAFVAALAGVLGAPALPVSFFDERVAGITRDDDDVAMLLRRRAARRE